MLVNLCKPFTVAAALLWAFTAYSDDMCDQLEGVLAEVESGSVDFQQSEVLEMNRNDWHRDAAGLYGEVSFRIKSGTPSATLPGASKCWARTAAYGSRTLYGCKWDEAPPRSEFATLQDRVGACLEQREFSYVKIKSSDEGQAFVVQWDPIDNYYHNRVQLKAYKATSKGMSLTFSYGESDEYFDYSRTVDREKTRARRDRDISMHAKKPYLDKLDTLKWQLYSLTRKSYNMPH